MTDPLSIANEMAQFDLKNREFYDSLTDEQKKKFNLYPMIRWGSSVQGSREMQEFYVIATNERLNKRFFLVNTHPKLQWLMATSVSPGMGSRRHNWIPPHKRQAGSNSMQKQLAELFPHLKNDELEVMEAITTKKELDDYIKAHGR